ncbi:hypothetical protein ABIE12_002237 [Serratia sp. 509]
MIVEQAWGLFKPFNQLSAVTSGGNKALAPDTSLYPVFDED